MKRLAPPLYLRPAYFHFKKKRNERSGGTYGKVGKRFNKGAIFYIDNMGVLCNIVNGSSRALDAGTLVFAIHLRMARLNITAWWEWVESESNCSDGGSRVGVSCPLAKELGIPLVELPFPTVPRNYLRMQPQEWEDWWKTQTEE